MYLCRFTGHSVNLSPKQVGDSGLRGVSIVILVTYLLTNNILNNYLVFKNFKFDLT